MGPGLALSSLSATSGRKLRRGGGEKTSGCANRGQDFRWVFCPEPVCRGIWHWTGLSF